MTTQEVPQVDQELAQLRQRLLDKIVHRETTRRRTALPWLLAAVRASQATTGPLTESRPYASTADSVTV